jgi:hypothetical protein
MKLDEILKSKGFSDADIAVLTPALRETLEATYSGLETERDTLRSVNDEWQRKLDSEYQPAMTKAEKELIAERMKRVAAEEKVKIAKDFGYLAEEDEASAPARPEAPAAFDPKQHNLVTMSDIPTFARAQGKAMSTYVDIANEHARLFGKSIEEFGTLYDDFLTAQQRNPAATIRSIWEAKYKVPERRAGLAKQEQEAHDKQVADAGVAKYISEHGGNPNLQMRAPSSHPFIPAKPTGDKGLPWERGTPNQLKTQRIERANKVQAQSELVH